MNAVTPVYGDAPGLQITPYRQIAKGDTSNSYMISLHNHTGTHIDAPRHFFDEGRPISAYSPDKLVFKHPLMIYCQKDNAALITSDDMKQASHLQGIDCLLLQTGFWRFRGEKKYQIHNPGIAPEAILWIRSECPGVRCIGIDCISISSSQHRGVGREAHRAAFVEKKGFGEPLLLIEDMKLDIMPEERIETIYVSPWQIDGLDSTPCGIIAKVVCIQ